MTTHTAEGLRPSPSPRSAPDPGPDREHAGDPWTDWAWPDAGWTHRAPPTPEPDPAWSADTATGHAEDVDTAAHRVVWDDDLHADPPESRLDHRDPGRAGWLPLLDDEVADRADPALPGEASPEAAGPSRRRRRVVGTLGVLAAVSVGFLGGIVADRVVGAPDDGTARLAGEVTTDADGTLAVRGVDGVLTAVRTSTGTRVVTANPVAGDLPAGTMVDVWTRRAPDGALEATAVAVRP